MALQTPIIKINGSGMINPFDATQSKLIEFTILGGDQVVKTQLQIYDKNNVILFDNTISNFTYSHLIPANTLMNSIDTYKARIRTYNINNDVSNWSSYALFKCLSSPTINITNINLGKINNQTELFTGSYSQLQGSFLESYKYYLYNSNSVLIGYSTELFDGLLQYQFTGFENGEEYYIELKVISEDGLEASTGLISFTSEYIQPRLQNIISLENKPEDGAIKVTAKVVRVLGQLGSGAITYENNDWINLHNGMIYFNSENGFKADGKELTLKIWCKDIEEGQKFITIYGTNGQIYLVYQYDKIYLYKATNDGIIKYMLFEEIGSIGMDTVFIFVQEVNGLMNFKTEVLSSNSYMNLNWSERDTLDYTWQEIDILQ